MRPGLSSILGAITALVLVSSVAWAARPSPSPSATTMNAPDAGPVTVTVDPTTTADDPTTTIDEPTTTAENPTTTAENPTTTAENPTTTAENPTTTAENPTTTAENPTTTMDDSTPSGSGAETYRIGHVATVSISWANGRMSLDSLSVADGWAITKQDIRSDRIELEFESGDDEARFRADFHDGRLRAEIRLD